MSTVIKSLSEKDSVFLVARERVINGKFVSYQFINGKGELLSSDKLRKIGHALVGIADKNEMLDSLN